MGASPFIQRGCHDYANRLLSRTCRRALPGRPDFSPWKRRVTARCWNAADPTVLRLGSGPVVRNRDGVYKGIPYAAPPVGNLRWKPPQPATPWTEPRRFDAFGPACPQPGPDGPTSEDCLTLNVWSPATGPQARLPVMVFLHGGAFCSGSGGLAVYNGEALASHGVVVATLNYRLGALGFLAHPLLSAESPDGVSGNYGLLDQQAALAWVRRNIEAFGGDPRNVTVFGQSAGAASIVCHLVSPAAGPLFDRAIVQSPVGPGSLRPLRDSASSVVPAEEVGWLLARELGIKETADAGVFLARLRAVPPEDLLPATDRLAERPGLPLEIAHLVFSPTVDGLVLPGHPVDRIREGRQHRKPLVVGATTDEATLFLDDLRPPAKTPGGYRRWVAARFGPDADAVLALAPGREPDLWNDLDTVVTARWFTTYARFLARAWASCDLPSWLYRFSRPVPGLALGILAKEANAGDVTREKAGVPHSADLFPVFGFTPWYLGFTGADRQFSRSIEGYWTGFAKTGHPAAPGLPDWPAHDPAAPLAMELGETAALRPAPDQPLAPLVEAAWRTTMY